MDIVDRFFKHVDKTDACWLWIGAKSRGYGYFRVFGKSVRAHHFSWETRYGKIPEKLCVLHKCDVPACVNPDHLFLGTQIDNIRDRDQKGRSGHSSKTHCKNGHEFNEINMRYYTTESGLHRHCRVCDNERHKQYYRKKERMT